MRTLNPPRRDATDAELRAQITALLALHAQMKTRNRALRLQNARLSCALWETEGAATLLRTANTTLRRVNIAQAREIAALLEVDAPPATDAALTLAIWEPAHV